MGAFTGDSAMPHSLINSFRHGGRLYGFLGFCVAKTYSSKMA
jgi:hypothetical protein